MVERKYKRILADCPAEDLIGRSEEMERLISRSARTENIAPLLVAGAPCAGVSELLKQVYDRLFFSRSSVIPFYFSLQGTKETASETAFRFLHEFLLQTVAFRRQDESILAWHPDIYELGELAVPSDGHWIDRLIDASTRLSEGGDRHTLLKAFLSAPIRAAASGMRVFAMIDDCHAATLSPETARVFSVIKQVFRSGEIPYVLAGRRRFSFEEPAGERFIVENLSFDDAAKVAERNAARHGVAINDETRDLIANQFDGNPEFIGFMFQAAGEKRSDLDSFLKVQQTYAAEIFGGRIRQYYDRVINGIAADDDVRRSILSLLDVAVTLGKKQLSVESWLKRLAIGEPEFSDILERLSVEELIRQTGNRVEAMDGNQVLTDYVTTRFQLEISGENRAALFGSSVATYLKRAPRLMARFYRQRAAIGLRQLLASFSLQSVPAGVIDHAVFAERYKGLPEADIEAGIKSEDAVIRLPQIVYTANAADLYKPIGDLSEKERSAVAIGFQEASYSDEDEIAWVAGEIDSKLEASKDLAEFWCDRLEMVALMCGFTNYRVWLIAPEGFTEDALEMLAGRNAFGSNHRQIKYLRQMLSADNTPESEPLEEYEVVVPMDGESELIAANALEEIAKRHDFSPRAVNQIKTALLEASINAAEHSLSPDRRIHQKFRVEDGKIVVTVTNRGLRLIDRASGEKSGDDVPERRGWGLKLIERLMDDVRIAHTDDGTAIVMTKYLQKEAAA